MLVSDADHFRWRDGGFGDLIPLLGDGLLTIDGDFHKQLAADHAARPSTTSGSPATATSMDEEVERGAAAAGTTASSSTSTRGRASSRCASRCARCSASIPTSTRPARPRARLRARARATTARTTGCRCCAARARRARGLSTSRGGSTRSSTPRSPTAAAPAAAARTCSRCCSTPELSDRHVRDQVMTLLFAGHDTDHRDRLVPVLGARATETPRLATSCSTRRSTRRCASTRRPGSARAARARDVRASHGHRDRRGRAGQLLLVGLAPAARRVGGAARVPPRALRTRGARADPAGRLRPVRRRLADLPRDALRPARDPRPSRPRSASASASSGCPASGSRIRQTPTLGPARAALPVRIAPSVTRGSQRRSAIGSEAVPTGGEPRMAAPVRDHGDRERAACTRARSSRASCSCTSSATPRADGHARRL